MNITTNELKQIRLLISKNDKQDIAKTLNLSERTIEAVINGQRVNHNIEKAVVKRAEIIISKLLLTLDKIKAKNIPDKITIEQYNSDKENALWTYGRAYLRYMDIYLQYSHIKFNSPEELYDKIRMECADIMQYQQYVIDIAVRLLGITPENAIKHLYK